MFLNAYEFEKCLIFYGAPTLVNLKVASLYHIDMAKAEMDYWIDYYNPLLSQKNMCLYRFTRKQRGLLFLYHKQKLWHLLNHDKIKKMFMNYHYNCLSVETILQCLQKRLQETEFPHEIGLLLGYPLQDVVSFIDGKPCLVIGYWKVYGHLKSCQKTFWKYQRCTNELMNRFSKGMTLEKICQII